MNLMQDCRDLVESGEITELGEAVRGGLKAIATIPDHAKLWMKLVELGKKLSDADRVAYVEVLKTCSQSGVTEDD